MIFGYGWNINQLLEYTLCSFIDMLLLGESEARQNVRLGVSYYSSLDKWRLSPVNVYGLNKVCSGLAVYTSRINIDRIACMVGRRS